MLDMRWKGLERAMNLSQVSALASGTIDVLMMRIQTYRASGSDREEYEGCGGR